MVTSESGTARPATTTRIADASVAQVPVPVSLLRSSAISQPLALSASSLSEFVRPTLRVPEVASTTTWYFVSDASRASTGASNV